MSNTTWDVMVDLETYDNICTAAIASIGAVKFNIATGEIGDTMYCTVSPKSCKEYGLSFFHDTIEWWKQQPIEAQRALRVNNIDLPDALEKLAQFYSGCGKISCWRMFDVPVLDHAYRKIGKPSPWMYWDGVECSGISNLLGVKIDRKAGVHHNALDDAINQAKHMIKILRGSMDNE